VGTLLADLLTPEEAAADVENGALRFDIPLLTERLLAITDRIEGDAKLARLKLGYFGASTGAAAALSAAAQRPELIRAVVSRGGRPDLSGSDLHGVHAPSLFIVGGHDLVVLGLNREAVAQLPRETERKTEIIPSATHLFEESGTLDRVAELARSWFRKYFALATVKHAGASRG
jgi:pimeloyl-ACP methyl ester carboxylesterase